MAIRTYVLSVLCVFGIAVGASRLAGPHEETVLVAVPSSAARGGPVLAQAESGEYLSVPNGPLSDRIRFCGTARLVVRRAWLLPSPQVLSTAPATGRCQPRPAPAP